MSALAKACSPGLLRKRAHARRRRAHRVDDLAVVGQGDGVAAGAGGERGGSANELGAGVAGAAGQAKAGNVAPRHLHHRQLAAAQRRAAGQERGARLAGGSSGCQFRANREAGVAALRCASRAAGRARRAGWAARRREGGHTPQWWCRPGRRAHWPSSSPRRPPPAPGRSGGTGCCSWPATRCCRSG